VPLILIDLDGTLADPGDGVTQCIAHALCAFGLAPPPAESLRRFIGPPLEAAFSTLLPDPTPERVQRAIAHYRERFADFGQAAVTPYPGSAAFLAGLGQRGWPAILVTFKSHDHALPIVERLGFAHHLHDIRGADPAQRPSKAELIEAVLTREGVAASEVVMVGDRHHDIEAAHANGAAAVGVDWGYGSRAELESAGADWICGHSEEVLERLDAWFHHGLPVPRAELIALRRTPRTRPEPIDAPGPGQVSCWDFPRPPRIVPAGDTLHVEHRGQLLAESARGLAVQETAGPPTYYLPPDDVDLSRLEPLADRSLCEWKGVARYWQLQGGGEAVAWSYPAPLPGYEPLASHIAFFPGRLDACYVGEARARPQPGDYYGGWVTPAVSGPFKGLPGSERW
jgi:phosphoglycolate phosphatase-like HAD superfamily hydrolase/uncharacterized protein (DUF427 family)